MAYNNLPILSDPRVIDGSALPPSLENLKKIRQLYALRARYQRAKVEGETERFGKYFNQPVKFVNEVCKEFVWSKQAEILNSIAAHRRTAVQSCHDAGKSFIAARAAAYWIGTSPPGDAFVVTSAPTFVQVRNILWRELNRAHKRGTLPGRMNQTEWFLDDEIVAFGRKPADMDTAAFQGIHQRRVLVIFDEACGIPRPLWNAADTLITNEESKFLAIGNPDDPTSEFAEVCKPGSGWNLVRINAFDTPNMSDEPVPERIRPLLVSPIWIEEKRRKWGEGSPLWKSKVLGEFPDQSDDGLVPYTALRAAVTRELVPGKPVELGVDVARFGDDSTVIYLRRGNVARKHKKFQNRDIMYTVGQVVLAVRETGATRVKIDDAGLGGGVTDRLNELRRDETSDFNAEVVPINVGEGAMTRTADERFKNLRAELSWNLRARFVDGDIDIEDDDDVLSQASQIKYFVTSKGEIQIEAKDDMKKRTGGVSPDDWDALVLVFARPSVPGFGMLEFLQNEAQAAERERAQRAKELAR